MVILKDEIISPKTEKTLTLNIKNPFQVYKKMEGLTKEAFGFIILKEKYFGWDLTSDPRPFSAKFEVEKRFDRLTKALIYINIEGAQPSIEENFGSLKLAVSAILITEIPLNGIKKILLSLPYTIYFEIFYKEQRAIWMNNVRIMVDKFLENLKNLSNFL